MVEQLAGAASASIIALAYLILLQVMTAIVVFLSQFLVLQVRSLRSMLASEKPTADSAPPIKPYRIGGGLMKWD
jgi:hypothetical protein